MYNTTPKPLLKENDPLYIIQSRKTTHNRPATIAGPMVRYSKLPFRQTCRDYSVDIVYTPMILAREFVRNKNARLSDFSTNSKDTPLIVQVGVNNVSDILKFADMVAPYCDGIGINCGCPIKEQVREGIGCALIYNPDLICSLVKAVKEKYHDKLRLETKIRIHDDLNQTIELCKKIIDSGADWITIHGRTRTTRSSTPVNLEAIKTITAAIKDYKPNYPVVANGDCFQYKDLFEISKITNTDAVMSVRGVLANPSLFENHLKCPWGCIEIFINWSFEYNNGIPFQLFQHHLFCMMENMMIPKHLIKQLMETRTYSQLIDWIDETFILKRIDDPGFGQSIEPTYRQIKSI
ncbi:hypothetical protein TBLA_0A06320 [Henningerozyma blattae CBS 6284]|uniref:tRNA-dihydrouridine synthase n=1 Tax=Henningerozyma blattae (strain ATCC 34711 / CBS 6284 / DSM 70876 / NBRC 10599 / NRRL Y-10934 / UCD 77-7) TaxID=1071380 RepID=I2GWC1_HENB6|nr:hypothetical protein TBLA_0A06320 [Tetrapisispora blattae CBS 6284]CCH58423.1 hypothetical protein TBLA_0A06320 [Tetrapisispora blattae CBS 6284]